MPEAIISYGLTTKKRVKDRISLNGSKFDTLLDRLIAAVTDYLESECGGRRFKRDTYTNEKITIRNPGQKFLVVKNIPLVSISSLQYRTGLKSSPNYTDFADDDWEIDEDGKNGLIRVYGMSQDINSVRITYVGGYLIDFENAGTATHTLPADLSDLAERLVVKLFTRRQDEGKSSETFESGTVDWKEHIDPFDRETIGRYQRVPEFV